MPSSRCLDPARSQISVWLVCLTLFGLACGDDEAKVAADPVVAVVNGEEITESELARELARLPQSLQGRYRDPEQRAGFVDQVVGRRLLMQAARERGIDRDPALRAKLEDLEQRLLVDALQRALAAEVTSDEQVRVYYDEHASDYSEERVRVRQILVRESGEARELRSDLVAGTDFIELAREHSIDPSARRGGDLGYVPRGRMDPAFEKVAFALSEPGELSEVVKTRFGYHIIQLLEKPAATTRPYEQVQHGIRQTLGRDALDRFLEERRSQATITIPEPAPSEEPSPDA